MDCWLQPSSLQQSTTAEIAAFENSTMHSWKIHFFSYSNRLFHSLVSSGWMTKRSTRPKVKLNEQKQKPAKILLPTLWDDKLCHNFELLCCSSVVIKHLKHPYRNQVAANDNECDQDYSTEWYELTKKPQHTFHIFRLFINRSS